MYWLDLHGILYVVKALKFPSDNTPILRYISFSKSITRSSSHNQLQHNYCRTSLSRHFYFNRIVRLWNKLPPIDLSSSISSIKYRLTTHLWDHFNNHFDPLNSCTFHYLCPCSSCFVQWLPWLLITLVYFRLLHLLEIVLQHFITYVSLFMQMFFFFLLCVL